MAGLAASFLLAPLSLLVGPIPGAPPSIAFLFRPWVMPPPLHLAVMLGLGLVWAAGMYCSARAYSLAQASVVAPFEYVVLPVNVLWGLVIWQDIPTWLMLAGALLTIASGVFLAVRERRSQTVKEVIGAEHTI